MDLTEDENKMSELNTIISDSPDELKKEEIQIPRLKTLNEMNENAVIDLCSGSIQPKKLSGPELLYQQFLKTQAKPKVNKEKVCMMNVLSIENGKLGIQKVEVKVEKEAELDHNRPGFSREKLKQNLRNQIVQKRLEIIKSKGLKSDFEPTEKCKSIENKENQQNIDESDEDYDPQEEEELSEESENDGEESTEFSKKKKPGTCAFIDNEAKDEDDENSEEEEDSSEESNDEEEQNDQNAQKKGRILKAFVDSDDEQQHSNNENIIDTQNTCNVIMLQDDFKETANIDSQATDFTFNEPSISEEILPSRLEELIDNDVEDEDLMDICSGQFLTTQTFEKQKDISQNILSGPTDISQKEPSNVNAVAECLKNKIENEELIINDEKSHKEESSTKNVKKLLESTDEDEADNECEDSVEKKRVKKKKTKQKIKKLGFSDDESDEENIQNVQTFDNKSELECEEEEEEEPQPDTNNDEILIDYDSEENEIEVKLTQKEKLKKAQEYFENEAELSESEWGSADEDEKDLDKYEIELADAEQFDEIKLREEVGRIHARKVMDEDLKNVKKIQELLFEDEENDGVGRDRKFRWKNQSEGFSLDDENARDADDDQIDLDEENEVQWRKMRYERETLINEQSQKQLESETLSEDILVLDQNSQTVTSSNTSLLVRKKFQIIRNSSCSLGLEATKKESPFLIKTDQRKFSNSFLSKGENTLAKIASFMSSKNINDDEVTNLSSHGGNSMSFAPIEKNIEAKKRKSDENDKDIVQKLNVKKRKINHQFLLDQLT